MFANAAAVFESLAASLVLFLALQAWLARASALNAGPAAQAGDDDKSDLGAHILLSCCCTRLVPPAAFSAVEMHVVCEEL